MIGHLLNWLICSVLARLFPDRYRVIPRAQDGRPLLRQFKLFATPEARPGVPRWYHVGIYLQSFVSPEVGERFHVHRWRRMVSFVLSGSFTEERYPGGYFRSHTGPSIYQMDDATIHRLASVEPRTWTLFVMLGRGRHHPQSGWGYYPRPALAGYLNWAAEIGEPFRVRSL